MIHLVVAAVQLAEAVVQYNWLRLWSSTIGWGCGPVQLAEAEVQFKEAAVQLKEAAVQLKEAVVQFVEAAVQLAEA